MFFKKERNFSRIIGTWKKSFRIQSFLLGRFFQKLGIFLADHWHLLIKSAAQNHLRIQECKKTKTGDSCNLEFSSFTQLKKYQKKVRLFTYSFSSTAFSIAIAIIAVQMFFGTGKSQGANYTFTQDDWLVTNTGARASHLTDQTNFKDYASKDAGIAPADITSGAGADIKLTAQSGSVVQTTDTDFNAGIFSNTVVSGTAAAASVLLNKSIIKVVSGQFASCSLKSDGTVWCWGSNLNGALGNGTGLDSLTPVQVSGITNVIDIAGVTESQSFCVLKNDGTVWCWGANAQGQLGNNSTVASPIPIQSGGTTFTGVKSIAKSWLTTCALKTDGTIWCWGSDYYGFFDSIGSGANRLSPVQMAGITGATYMSSFVGVYLKNDGNIYNVSYDRTLVGSGFLNTTMVSGSSAATVCALKTDGTVWCWSSTYVGDGTATNYATPVQITKVNAGDACVSSGGTCTTTGRITYVSAVNKSSCVVNDSGSVWCWGLNTYGQIGNNTTVDVLSPTQVLDSTGAGFLSNVVFVGTNGNRTCATKSSGDVFCWGYNPYGELGNTLTVNSSIPVQVHGQNNVGFLNVGVPYLPGIFTSSQIDLGQKSLNSSLNLSWGQTLNGLAAGSIAFQIASDVAPGGISTFYGSDGLTHADCNSGGCYTINTVQPISANHNGARYLKYKAFLKTADQTKTPSLDDVTISYQSYLSGKALVSSWYDTTDNGNNFRAVRWDEASVPAGTAVRFQVQTAPDSAGVPGAPTGFVGINSSGVADGAAFFTNSSNGCLKAGTIVTCTMPANTLISDNVNDRWLQYKMLLDSDGASTPQVNQVKLDYVVNSPPTFAIFAKNMSELQDTDGVLKFNYTLADADQTIFSTSYGADIGVTLATGGINNLVTTIPLAGTYASLPAGTHSFAIDQEQMTCTVSTSNLTTCTRAVNGTSASSHSAGATVWFLAETKTGDGAGKDKIQNYQGTWTIKTDLPGVYNATGRLRIFANDAQVANQVSIEAGATLSFILDTKDPTNVSITVDHRSDQETVTINKKIPANPIDDSTYKLYLSTTGTFTDANEIPLPTGLVYPYVFNYSSVLSTMTDSGTVWLRIKDAKGNTNDYNIANEIKVVIPPKPQRLLFYDISNVSAIPPDYRELIAWTELTGFAKFQSYNVVRATDGINFAALAGGTINNSTLNFLADKGLIAATKYYYKAFTGDTDGNYSAYSNTVNDVPDGHGSSDSTPPVISNIQIDPTKITTTSATVTWDTDEISDSTVGFTLDDQPTPEYLPEYGSASLTLKHSITITNLIPNKTYAVRIKSRDVMGNLKSLDKLNNGGISPATFKFITKDGPAILGFTLNQVSNNEVSISWNTSTNSDSTIFYSDTISNGKLVITPNDPTGNSGSSYSADLVTRHLQRVAGLTQAKKYYFYLTSQVGANIAIDDNAGLFYAFTTDNDKTKPIITIDSNQPTIKSNNQAVVMWSTDKQATTKLKYKKKTEDASKFVLLNPSSGIYDKSHYVVISNLLPETSYDFLLISADINGNETTQDNNGAFFNFKTFPDPDKNHPPLASIDKLTVPVENLFDTSAVVSFTTDQIASCKIDLTSLKDGKSTVITRSESGYDEAKNYNVLHSLALSNLDIFTDYTFMVSCHDNIVKDESKTLTDEKYSFITKAGAFKTREKLYTEAGAGSLGDHIPPVISNVSVSAINGESVTVSWDTDEKSSSNVRLGIVTSDENLAGDPLVNKVSANYVTSHTVIINGLIPATKYIFVASSTDAAGNISESSESSFTTASPSSISSIKAESKSLGEALITWSTSTNTTSTVEYGLTTSYGEKKESTTMSQDHSIDLSNLNQSVVYHYRVKGKDKDNKLYASSDQTFQPKSPPQITNAGINDVTEHEAKVSFDTNVPTDATVTYFNIADNADNGSQSNTEMSTKHMVQLKNLTQGASFKISIKARDEQGSESQQDTKDLATGKDETPPKIDMVKTDLALAQNDKVQAIISWVTDEQSTTSILYKESRNAEPKEVNISNALTTSHVVVLTIFKPGTVYYFNAKSSDASGNTSVSSDYALLTPKRKENIIQIIITNFTEIFGWARR